MTAHVILTAIKEANMYCHPLDPSRPETDVDRARQRRIDWADDELRRHDAAVAMCWGRQWAALTEAMAKTGADTFERIVAADCLHDLMQDVFGGIRKHLLSNLDDEGGDITRHPCPLTSLHKAAVS